MPLLLNPGVSPSERFWLVYNGRGMGGSGSPPEHYLNNFFVGIGVDRGKGYQGYLSIDGALEEEFVPDGVKEAVREFFFGAEPPMPRPWLKERWEEFFQMGVFDGPMPKAFLHFPEGADAVWVQEWFREMHAKLDKTEAAVIEIRTPGWLRTKVHKYPGRDVTVTADGRIFTDDVERPELRGLQIAGIHCRGKVTDHGGAEIHGMVNGVMVHRPGSAAAAEPPPSTGPRR